jgi:hypothetical protein
MHYSVHAPIFRIVGIFLMAIVTGHIFPTVTSSLAFFTDREASANTFLASSVGIQVAPPSASIDLVEHGTNEFPPLSVTVDSTRGHVYDLSLSGLTGGACANLTVTASHDALPVYTGTLAALSVTGVPIGGQWVLALADTGAVSGTTCSFTIPFEAYDPGVGNGGGGFSASHQVTFDVAITPAPVAPILQEVIPAPIAPPATEEVVVDQSSSLTDVAPTQDI